MSDIPGHHVRQARHKRSVNVHLADVTMLVQVPGQPAEVRVFTEDEQFEASEYAAQIGGIIVALPQPLPDAYVTWCTAAGVDFAE